MKKITLTLSFCCVLLTSLVAQVTPLAFNYSAVARNASGQPIANSPIGIQIGILKTSITGQVVYSENHVVNTDAFGLFNLIIGSGAIQSGNMASIDWSADNYYLNVGMDASGGFNFQTMGTTQLLSVPYALHAATADSLIGGTSLTETDPVFTNAVAAGITQEDTLKWNKDNDSINELQTLSISNDTIYLTNGGFAVIPQIVSENDPVFTNAVAAGITQEDTLKWNKDNDSTNELQMLSISNDTIYLSNGGFAVLPPQAANNGGKTYIELYGDVTDAQADSILAADFGPNTQFVYITNTTALTSVDLSGINNLIELQITDNDALTSVIAPNLKKVSKSIEISSNPSLTTLQINSLLRAYRITITVNSALSLLDLSNLLSVDDNFGISNSALGSLSLPNLSSVGRYFTYTRNTASVSLSLPNLTSVGTVLVQYNAALASLDLSNLSYVGGGFTLNHNALPTTEINEILALIVAQGQGFLSSCAYLNLQTPLAPPSGQGLLDKAIIQSWPKCIYTD